MMNYTRQSATKEIRRVAKKVGLTFKPIRYLKINGFRAYEFCDRQTNRAS